MGWEILEVYSGKLYEKDKTNRKLARVKCDCGKIEVRRYDHVKDGRSKSCKSCSCKETCKTNKPPVVYKGINELSKSFFNLYKYGAERRNIPFEITIQDAYRKWEDQCGVCAISGIKLILKRDMIKKGNWRVIDFEGITASLDRIDSTKGYTPDNIQWVHKIVNIMKSNMTDKELIEWANIISSYQANREPS